MQVDLEDVSFTYQSGTALAVEALRDVTMGVGQTDFVGIAGPTGSGKSTLVQHLNGLLIPTSGQVLVDGILSARVPTRQLRASVGLVFQFPENQLFEATVADDVAFGPRNLGCPGAETISRVDEALRMVGLDAETYGRRNPFELSGGEQRRVAIAGVLAMRPRILVLDEPTAGLDSVGRRDLTQRLRDLHYGEGIGIVVVSHALDEIAELVERLIIMREGRIVFDGRPRASFGRTELLSRAGLQPPQGVALLAALRRRGVIVDCDRTDADSVAQAIAQALGKPGGGA